MVIYGSDVFEFSVSTDMKKGCSKGGGSREGMGTFMSNTCYRGIKNYR